MLHRNLPLKAASLILGIFLWFWVMLNEENPIIERTVQTSLKAEGIQSGIALQRDLPGVDVRLRGLKRDMSEVEKGTEAHISCRGLDVGNYRLGVQVQVPDNVTVVSVHPAEVPVVLERIVSESRPLEVRLVGEPPAGYELKSSDHSPKLIRISGARSRVDRVARIVLTVDIGGLVPGIPVSLVARSVDSSGSPVEGVSLAPPRVNVTVNMEPVVATRTLPIVVRTRGSLPQDFTLRSVEVDPAMATVLLPASRAEEITHVDTEFISLGNVRGSFTRHVRLVVPDGVNLVGDPEVRVTVQVQETAQSTEPSEQGGEENSPTPSN